MAKVNYTNIVVGDGRLFVADAGVINTIDVDINANGEDSTYYMGATQEGVSVSWEPDLVDIEVDQFGDAARVILSKIKVSIKTTLAEATLKNIATAWNYATSGASATQSGVGNEGSGTNNRLNIGIPSTYPREKYVRIQGTAPGTTASTTVYRTYRNTRCLTYAASEHTMSRNDNVKFSVEFRVLPDSQYTGKEYGYITDTSVIPYASYTV